MRIISNSSKVTDKTLRGKLRSSRQVLQGSDIHNYSQSHSHRVGGPYNSLHYKVSKSSQHSDPLGLRGGNILASSLLRARTRRQNIRHHAQKKKGCLMGRLSSRNCPVGRKHSQYRRKPRIVSVN
jgi:hypothetical protein